VPRDGDNAPRRYRTKAAQIPTAHVTRLKMTFCIGDIFVMLCDDNLRNHLSAVALIKQPERLGDYFGFEHFFPLFCDLVQIKIFFVASSADEPTIFHLLETLC
jgi:hypothetical protein